MNDHHPDDEAVDLEVRALLADARATTPMPPEVATRLDDVLAGLVAETPGGTADATAVREGAARVADLAAARARRRRRTWVGAAAAAVVVVTAGATLPAMLPAMVTGGQDATTAQDTLGSTEGGGRADTDADADTDAGDPTTDLGTASEELFAGDRDTGGRTPRSGATPVTLTRAGLEVQVAAHVAGLDAPTPATDAAPTPQRSTAAEYVASLPCPWPGRGVRSAATLDGEPATLVVTRRRGGSTVVRVVTCADGSSTVAERVLLDLDR